MQAASVLTLGLLELREFQKWVISIQLHPSECHRQECVIVLQKDAQVLACW